MVHGFDAANQPFVGSFGGCFGILAGGAGGNGMIEGHDNIGADVDLGMGGDFW